MNEPQLVWRLGRWIGGRQAGTAHLGWSGGKLEIDAANGRIQAVRGLDATAIAAQLGTSPTGRSELLAEARSLALERHLPETRAVGGAKEILQRALRSWLTDPDRTLSLSSEAPQLADGTTISMTHAVVELILADTGSDLSRRVLPDLDVLLRRSPSFLELYAPLRLSEEADLIVAKITGERSAADVVAHSPHDPEEVLRLVAALVAAGMLEPVPATAAASEDVDEEEHHAAVESPPVLLEPAEPARKKLPLGWIAVTLAILAVLTLAAVVGLRWSSGHSSDVEVDPGHWAIAVDMGCAPEELQRVLATARRHPKDLRPVAAPADDGDPCWRLVWGDFGDFDDAEAALGRIPSTLTRDGFKPHVVALPDTAIETPPPLPGG